MDDKNKLIGIVDFDSIKSLALNPFRIKFTNINQVISQPQAILNYEDGMEHIMEQYEISKAEFLPVVRYEKYFGMISKLQLLESYRDKLKEMIID